MNWYLQSGNESDVVLNSKVKLSRNIKGINFTPKASKDDLKKVFDLAKKISIGYGLHFKSLDDLSDVEKQEYVDKGILPEKYIKSKNAYKAILINDDENICIYINGMDHLTIEVFATGFEVENLTNLAIEIDRKIEEQVDYSFSEKYGYLTPNPMQIGTGMKAEVMVHVPGLSLTKNLRKIINVVNNIGLNIKGIYSESTKNDGDIFIISNNQTLGVTEKEIAKNIKLITKKIIDQERLARKILTKNSLDIEDKICRSFGILAFAKKIESDEILNILSIVKLGVDLGIIKEINDAKVSKLYLETKQGNIQKRIGDKASKKDQAVERAKIIKEIINEE